MKISRSLFCFGSLLLFSVGGCRPVFDRHFSAAAFDVQGEVTIQSAARKFPLTNASLIDPGDDVQTAAGARAAIVLLPGIVIELGSETQISISSLRFSKDGDETIEPVKSRKAIVRLERGTVTISVDWVPSPSHLTLQTALGGLAVDSGSACRATLRDNELHLLCVRRAVNFVPLDRANSTRIVAGFFLNWPHTPAAQPTAHSGVKAQAELAEILREEAILRQHAKMKYEQMGSWEKR